MPNHFRTEFMWGSSSWSFINSVKAFPAVVLVTTWRQLPAFHCWFQLQSCRQQSVLPWGWDSQQCLDLSGNSCFFFQRVPNDWLLLFRTNQMKKKWLLIVDLFLCWLVFLSPKDLTFSKKIEVSTVISKIFSATCHTGQQSIGLQGTGGTVFRTRSSGRGCWKQEENDMNDTEARS